MKPALMTLHIGVTATREGMTINQYEHVISLFEDLKMKNSDVILHHGDCVGGDEQAHILARKFGFRVVVHPPDNPSKRAFCDYDEIWPEKSYLIRNRDIVDNSSLVIAIPKEASEILRSGTWATVRYARSQQKLWTIVKPTEQAFADRS